ncbi:Protein of unknown function [Desulfatibacillum alkenivorans DSM 16219]|jgi:hypothetical protein|uniref:DUF3015 domain-containing protein n=1 Tax=Desulfatibacillum alkenivorans DSM 16219 TaxID=1121393 RepID=A0A1M6JBP4_9BACT|nr:DUF3015 domain-containing protein [Desulfatibacillum alkenivorans]SHJ44111.1 Protein of unknown function [Desulfatibacillum alkenivorans DSM 16219]
MKKGLLAAALCIFLAISPAAFADQSNYGCGLGSMVIDNNESLVSQTFAATLNGCFANQLFGMSSGTSNCDKPDSIVYNEKINIFVADNMDSLASDIAKGQGEYLDTLATLMEVPADQRPVLYSKLQNNFSVIYPSDQVTHTDVLRNIEAVL